jgi:hypothetical protein
MKSNNIENIIREKLNSREIQPSNQAWDRLDAMLTLQEKPKKKSKFLYFSMAASVVALAIVLLVLNAKTKSLQIDVLPQSNSVVNNSETPKNESELKNNQDVVEIEREVENLINAPKIPKNSVSIVPNEKQNIIQTSPESELKIENTKPTKLTPEQLKRAQLLLASIEKEDKLEKITPIISNQETKVTVNANQLLENVEVEMNQSHKEKMVKKVSKNLSTIKEAWVNRNLE